VPAVRKLNNKYILLKLNNKYILSDKIIGGKLPGRVLPDHPIDLRLCLSEGVDSVLFLA